MIGFHIAKWHRSPSQIRILLWILHHLSLSFTKLCTLVNTRNTSWRMNNADADKKLSYIFGISYEGLASQDVGKGRTRFCVASHTHFFPWRLERESMTTAMHSKCFSFSLEYLRGFGQVFMLFFLRNRKLPVSTRTSSLSLLESSQFIPCHQLLYRK